MRKKAFLVWGIIVGVLGVGGLFTQWWVGLILLLVAALLIFLYFKVKVAPASSEVQKQQAESDKDGKNMFTKKTIRSKEIKLNGFRRIIAIDTETTGLNPENDRIVEIGAAVFEKEHDPVSTFSTLINPGTPIPSEASKVNHITNETVKNAPRESEAMAAFADFLKSYASEDHPLILVAHNASFDIRFIENAFKRYGINVSGMYVDTLSSSRSILKDLDNYKLGTLAEYYGIENPQAHRALGDAETVGHLFRHLLSGILNS